MSDQTQAPAQAPSTDDWRVEMLRTASQVGTALSVRDRSRNALIPNNFLDFSDAGFPSDIIVKAVPIPATGNTLQLMQYQEYREKMWQHVRFDWISSNGGLDGKANVAGAEGRDLGNGNFVATLSGYYLMYADKGAYLGRRASNIAKRNQLLEDRVHRQSEESEHGSRRTGYISDPKTFTMDELLDYEASLPPLRQGIHISD